MTSWDGSLLDLDCYSVFTTWKMASEMYRYDGLSSSSSSDHDERQKQRIPAAYALEPLRKDVSGRLVSSRLSSSSSSSSDGGMPVDDEPDRTASTDWCSCTRCSRMPTVDECKCCREMGDICHRMGELECITKHPKFPIICLDIDVLEVGLLSMRDLRAETLIRPISSR